LANSIEDIVMDLLFLFANQTVTWTSSSWHFFIVMMEQDQVAANSLIFQ